jgi:hypothetical protein
MARPTRYRSIRQDHRLVRSRYRLDRICGDDEMEAGCHPRCRRGRSYRIVTSAGFLGIE